MSAFKIGLNVLLRTCLLITLIFGLYISTVEGLADTVLFVFVMVFVSLISLCLSPILTKICKITSRLPYTNNSSVAWFAFAWSTVVVLCIMGIFQLFGSGLPDLRFLSLVSVCCWIATYKIKRKILNFIKATKSHENDLV